MSADSPRRSSGSRGSSMPSVVPPQVVSDRSIIDSAIGFINDVTLAHQPHTDPKDTITWARFESAADISDPRYGDDWELEGNVAPPLLLILGYGLGVQVWAIPANGEAVEVLSWRHGIVSALRVLPTPSPPASAMEEHVRADEPVDAYAEKRPLIAMVDGSTSVGAQPQFSAVNFVSLKTGTQVKTIKFKNPVLDILANRSSIAVTFHERIAVFDARTLEDRLSVTTCFPSPGINPNPVALGPRWLAYAEHKLLHSKRSGGGCDGEGVASYTATVLNAAKSLGKGLRELGEQVAAGLAGSTVSGGNSKNNSFDSGMGPDAKQPGVVTIIDTKYPIKDYSPTSGTPLSGHAGSDPIVAHFVAHSEAVVALEFDNTGLLLVTADRRGHDFHIFRVQPHPVGSSLAAVHHLYALHRGDTSAKVQNIAFSLDSRWVAVSTLRGTTHVFPITPYGGPMGVRTHTSLHVVNKLSRFHRSAGLSADGRSSSPISHSESTTFVQSLQPFHNPTLPPFSRPTVVLPLAQLRQPLALGSPPGSATMGAGGKSGGGGVGGGSGGGGSGGSGASQRQRLSSLSDDSGKPLSVCAIFAKSRSWLLEPPNATREAPHRIQRKAVDSLFVMAGHGALIQYDLDTKLASNVAKEKICDDTPIELEVEAKAQWNLVRRKDGSQELMPPLCSDNWLIRDRNSCMLMDSTRHYDDSDDRAESWLSQVEIITHAGPHRRLWMGPQFVFKTYNAPSGSNLNHVDAEAVEIGVSKPSSAAAAAVAATRGERSSPLNMPLTATAHRSAVPVLIESGSYSSIEQSPKLMDRFRHGHLDSDFSVAHGDSRLKEDLADAMRESPSVSAARKDTGRLPSDAASSDNVPFYDALAEHEHENDEDDQAFASYRFSAAAALASALPNIYSYDAGSNYESFDSFRKPKASIENIVNPLGTVTTVTAGMSTEIQTDILDEVVSQLAAEDCVIHENCDESLFRPVVAIFCDANTRPLNEEEKRKEQELCKPPEIVGNKLIVPVIDKDVDDQLCKREKQKNESKSRKQKRMQDTEQEEHSKFAELSKINKNSRCKSAKESPFSVVKKEGNVNLANIDDGKKSNDAKKFEIILENEKDVESVMTTESISRKTQLKQVQEKPSISNRSLQETPADAKKTTTEQQDKQILSKRMAEKARKIEEKEITSKKVIVNKNEFAEKDSEYKEAIKQGDKSKIKSTKTTEQLFEGEKPVEFKRMTPLPVEKSKKQTADKSNSSANEKTAAATNETISTAAKYLNTELKISSNIAKDKNDKYVSENLQIPNRLNESIGKDIMKKSSKPQKEEVKNTESKVEAVKLVEPVEIYRAPKLPKKNKKKQNKSGSNSESEEVVEVASAERATAKSKSVDLKYDETSKDSSEEGSIDLADSLLENKSNMQDTMYVSCTQRDNDNEKSSSDKKEVSDKITNKRNIQQKEYPANDLKTKNKQEKDNAHLLKKDGAMEKEWLAEEVSSPNEKEREEKIKKDVLSLENNTGRKGKVNLQNTAKIETKEAVSAVTASKITEDDRTDKPTYKIMEGIEKKEYCKKDAKKIENPNADTAISFETETLEEVIVRNEPSKVKRISKTNEILVSPEQKTPKKNQTDVVKFETDKMPPPPIAMAKKKISAQFDDNKVITEQPTKAKQANSVHMKPFSYKEDAHLPSHIESRKADETMKTSTPQFSSSKGGVDDSSALTKNGQRAECSTAEAVKQRILSPSLPSASNIWQTQGSAENSLNTKVVEDHYPSLSKVGKIKKSSKTVEQMGIDVVEKLIPDIQTPNKSSPQEMKEPLSGIRNSKNPKKITPFVFDDFPQLKSLPTLPPLPSLEPLEVISVEMSRTKDAKVRSKDLTESIGEQVSLINFESPLQENPTLDRKIIPPPRGFTEQNLIFALCGSLHYENENAKSTLEISQLPLIKSEGNEYEEIEKGVHDSKAPSYTREKMLSSPQSSASEEIIVLEEKKMSKKQKRKQQQMELELQKRKTDLATNEDEVDEELRPLITLSDSHLENFVDTMAASDHFAASFPAIPARSAEMVLNKPFGRTPAAITALFSNSTVTTADCEGAKPASVLDEKAFTLPTSSTIQLKNKKMEYKINLLAGVEAVTSSSTSSAEESGVEASGRLSDQDGAQVSVTSSAPHPMPQRFREAAQHSTTKNKTKRHKR